jgi:serine phosphatase RsbU (regulator of sigma subunit)
MLYEREHHIAEMLQQALIPPTVPETLYGYEVAVVYQPALREASVGGDFYDIFELGAGRLGVLIGDVAGKGLRAAIRVAMARYVIRSYAYIEPRPARVMALANAALCKDRGDELHMLTAFLAIVDTQEGKVLYASAGHEPPIVCSSNGCVEELQGFGGVLGVLPEMSYGESERALAPGDKIVMVTDGITEARRNGVLLGESGLIDALRQAAVWAPTRIAEAILQAAREHAGGDLQDDVAIVVLGRAAGG